MAKTVAIVGAGPSGLVSAKTLLHHATAGAAFSVTLFDEKNRLGGLWPCSPDDTEGLVHPRMLTNQSKHTVAFSDLAWEPWTPQFPQAWQAGRYLQSYRAKYLRALEDDDRRFSLRLGEKVVQADPLAGGGWNVSTRTAAGDDKISRFDYLLIASGFFGKPKSSPGIPDKPVIPVIHSSQYRDLKQLLRRDDGGKGGRILVVGGQMSGFEIAGTIGSHLSSAINSPGPSEIPNVDKYSLHHISSKPLWVKPLYVSPNPASQQPNFLPVDLAYYNLNLRPKPLVDSQGYQSPEACRNWHGVHLSGNGSDQSEVHPTLGINSDHDLESPAYLAISENYMDLVRSGLIGVSRGKLDRLEGTTAHLSPTGEQIKDVAAVVLATGFGATESLSFLPQSVVDTFQPDPQDLNTTFALAYHSTHHPEVPQLGFCGFYRSPYWGVMEMQARFLTAKWSYESSPDATPIPAELQSALDADRSIERTLALRQDKAHVSQFSMGDYCFLMQEFARALGLETQPAADDETALPRVPVPNGPGLPLDLFTPARILSSPGTTDAMRTEAAQARKQALADARAGLEEGKWVAKAAFRSLLGEWSLERDLSSRLPTHPSGHFSGTARFLLRDMTDDGLPPIKKEDANANANENDKGRPKDRGQANEYLYIEEGEFRMPNGAGFRASRRYVWRFDEAKDKISVWFVKTDDDMRADYLFHEVDFQVDQTSTGAETKTENIGFKNSTAGGKEGEAGRGGWRAKAGHLCIDDFYDVMYEFMFSAVNLREWTVGYKVQGPKKDYEIRGVYKRPLKGSK